ncbi:MAG: ParB/RepB/Spo0J family partition protein [Fibrobacter sp.]|nr:ParB/RepB/Spo0J family partition protein [Fibrobacter sp.]
MEIKRIKLKNIIQDDRNPRSDIGDVRDLEASIRNHGLIEPIVVTWDVSRCVFRVVVGNRRLQALMNIGYEEIDCIVKDSDENLNEISIAENIVRLDMSPADECRAIKRLVDCGEDIRSIAVRFGHNARWAVGRLKMAELGEDILARVDSGKITLAHAEALSMCDSDGDVKRFADMCSYNSPEEIRRRILAEKKNLAKAPFDVHRVCRKCKKKTVKDQDLFGDVTESYCRDGECYCRNVKAVIDRKRRELLDKGYREYDGNWWAFENCRGFIRFDGEHSEKECEAIESIRGQGLGPFFMIDESTAEASIRWDCDEAGTDPEEDAASAERKLSFRVREIVEAKEKDAMKEVLVHLMNGVDDMTVAVLFDYFNRFNYDRLRFGVVSDGDADDDEDYVEGAVANIGERTSGGIDQREYIIDALVDELSRSYESETERAFWKMKERSEYEEEARRELSAEK